MFLNALLQLSEDVPLSVRRIINFDQQVSLRVDIKINGLWTDID